MSAGSPPPTAATRRRVRSSKDKARLIILGAALALAIVFAVLNLHKVSVNWIVTTTQTPLTVVIVVSFLVGAVFGALIYRRAAH